MKKGLAVFLVLTLMLFTLLPVALANGETGVDPSVPALGADDAGNDEGFNPNDDNTGPNAGNNVGMNSNQPDNPFIEPRYYADHDVVDAEGTANGELLLPYVVICRALNVRSTPSTDEARIGLLYLGDIVNVLAYEGNWAKIETEDGSDAYVYAAYLEAV